MKSYEMKRNEIKEADITLRVSSENENEIDQIDG